MRDERPEGTAARFDVFDELDRDLNRLFVDQDPLQLALIVLAGAAALRGFLYLLH